MGSVGHIDGGPESVIVVGAGIVGLSTAWCLQQHGVDVTVVDRSGIAAGASWANAGWIAPGLILPPNSPSVLHEGVRVLGSSASLRLPLTADAEHRFSLMQFAANYRQSSWERALRANVALNEECIDTFNVLIANGVDAPVTDAPITAVFRSTNEAERLLGELRQLENVGQTIYVTALSGDALREQVPVASSAVTAGLNINAQRFIDPRRFVEALGRSVVQRGATMHRLEIRDVVSAAGGAAVYPRRGNRLTADAVVISTGARLSGLAGRWLHMPMHVGRGYSFTVPVERPIPGPIYLPDVQVACTPYKGALRVPRIPHGISGFTGIQRQ